jgi:hypothetical protein
MANFMRNSFYSYDLSDQEVLQGSIFTSAQKAVLQNHLATEAEKKLQLTFNPNNPQEFLQEEAYLRGKIEVLQYLIEASDASQEVISANPTN